MIRCVIGNEIRKMSIKPQPEAVRNPKTQEMLGVLGTLMVKRGGWVVPSSPFLLFSSAWLGRVGGKSEIRNHKSKIKVPGGW